MQAEEKQLAEEMLPQGEQPSPKAHSFWKELLSWVVHLGVTALLVLLIHALLFQLVRVDGQSMCDTLQNGEMMLVTKPEYLFGDPKLGDVVTCRYPGRGNAKFVKRVMGLPGDVIEVRDNVVYRNGEAVEEPYLTPERNRDGFDMAPFTLGVDEYFVMGDNRDRSHDSRNYYADGTPSAITRDMITGHVRWILFPFSRIRAVD